MVTPLIDNDEWRPVQAKRWILNNVWVFLRSLFNRKDMHLLEQLSLTPQAYELRRRRSSPSVPGPANWHRKDLRVWFHLSALSQDQAIVFFIHLPWSHYCIKMSSPRTCDKTFRQRMGMKQYKKREVDIFLGSGRACLTAAGSMHIFSWGTAVPCWCQTLELTDLGAEGKVEGGVKHNHSLSNTRAHAQIQPQRPDSD